VVVGTYVEFEGSPTCIGVHLMGVPFMCEYKGTKKHEKQHTCVVLPVICAQVVSNCCKNVLTITLLVVCVVLSCLAVGAHGREEVLGPSAVVPYVHLGLQGQGERVDK